MDKGNASKTFNESGQGCQSGFPLSNNERNLGIGVPAFLERFASLWPFFWERV